MTRTGRVAFRTQVSNNEAIRKQSRARDFDLLPK